MAVFGSDFDYPSGGFGTPRHCQRLPVDVPTAQYSDPSDGHPNGSFLPSLPMISEPTDTVLHAQPDYGRRGRAPATVERGMFAPPSGRTCGGRSTFLNQCLYAFGQNVSCAVYRSVYPSKIGKPSPKPTAKNQSAGAGVPTCRCRRASLAAKRRSSRSQRSRRRSNNKNVVAVLIP